MPAVAQFHTHSMTFWYLGGCSEIMQLVIGWGNIRFLHILSFHQDFNHYWVISTVLSLMGQVLLVVLLYWQCGYRRNQILLSTSSATIYVYLVGGSLSFWKRGDYRMFGHKRGHNSHWGCKVVISQWCDLNRWVTRRGISGASQLSAGSSALMVPPLYIPQFGSNDEALTDL